MANLDPDVTVQLVGGRLDWLDSVASIVGALAWPALLMTCIVLFRAEIRAILSRVTSIGIGNLTAQVDQSLRTTEILSAATAQEGAEGQTLTEEKPNEGPLLTKQPSEDSADGASKAKTHAIEAAESPSIPSRKATTGAGSSSPGTPITYSEWAAQSERERSVPVGPRMVQAFQPVESLIRELASRYGIPPDVSTQDAVMALTGMQVLSDSFGNLLGVQTNLRNTVAQNGGLGLSEFQARQFVEQLAKSQSRLEAIIGTT